MRKPRLMTPGPAMVPEDVLLELARPVIHHRSDEAKAVITEVIAGLKEVFQTKNDVVILTASGTGAMEAAAGQHGPSRAGKPWCLTPGISRRGGPISARPSASNAVCWKPSGAAVDPERVAEALRQHPDTAA